MTFHSERNAAKTALDKLEKLKVVEDYPDRSLKVAELRVGLAQAEAHHELATAMTNMVVAIASLRR
jgi:hypothetical protein